MRTIFLALLVSAFSLPVSADPLPAQARTEVIALLDRLQASGCEFNRNDSWYNATEARSHLLRKLAYLEDKNLVKSAEQFIELGASKSSRSGKPYLVRCGSLPAVESGAWLSGELKAMRSGARAQAPAAR